MHKHNLAKYLLSIFLFLSFVSGTALAATCGDYTQDPIFVTYGTAPNVLLILDNSGSMNEFAYHEVPGCREGGTRAWTGYDEGKAYYGIFNPDRIYKYDNTHHYFYEVGDTVDDPSTPITERAVCLAANCTVRAFSGNWLNWWTMRRIDVAKKVLTGGRLAGDASEYVLIGTQKDRDDRRIFNDYASSDTPPSPNYVPPAKNVYYTPFRQGIYSYFTDSATRNPGGDAVPAFNVQGAVFDGPSDMTGATCIARTVDLSSNPIFENEAETDGTYFVAVKVPTRPQGVVQQLQDQVRFGYMRFNYGRGPAEGYGAGEDGGTVLHYVGDNTTVTTPQGDVVLDMIQTINNQQGTTWTPLAETLNEAMRYFKQKTPAYGTGHYTVSTTWDPYYFDGDYQECARSFILYVSDGEATQDSGVKSCTDPTDAQCVDATFQGDSGADLFDDIAFKIHREDLRPEATLPGNQTIDLYTVFCFDDSATAKDAMKRAARAGGFEDLDGDGQPYGNGLSACSGPLPHPTGCAEWDKDGDGVPDNYFEAQDGNQMAAAILGALTKILQQASSGTSSSVVAASRGGEGTIYQAIFYPRRQGVVGTTFHQVKWVGDVRALLLDKRGQIYEDTNQNQQLDPVDDRIIYYYDTAKEDTRVCVNGTIAANGTCRGKSKGLDEVHYLWSAADWLNNLPPGNVDLNRPLYDHNSRERYIFTWIDMDNDGVVDRGGACNEVIAFEKRYPTNKWNVDLPPSCFAANRGPVNLDFAAATLDEVNDIISWVRGEEGLPGMRSRMAWVDADKDGSLESEVPWRLGDVVHSSPMVVSRPAENYHLLYNDRTYAVFARQYRNRRYVIYFGGNDGMLHAVNGGFYNPAEGKYCQHINPAGKCENSSFELGAELWAYVPTNLLPHLKCLTQPDYRHKFYVDLRPRIFDVRIFPEDADHPYGWGTILVGGLRFGGGKIRYGELDLDQDGTPDYPADNRESISSYFVLDITNPEKPPVLLGEMTRTIGGNETDLGYSTVIPTMIPMKDGNETHWYLVLGSGPTAVNGTSTQRGRLAVFPLDRLTATPQGAFRVPDAPPSFMDEAGRFELPDNASFVSDPITIDLELRPDYKADAVYFGTVSGDFGSWGGKLYRLVTRDVNATTGQQRLTKPYEWAGLLSPMPNPVPLLDAGAPITAAPTVATDGRRFWVYFGTGRYFDPVLDKFDTSTQAFYGVMEPTTPAGGTHLTWETVSLNGTPGAAFGQRGLVRTDQILVESNSSAWLSDLSCKDGTTDCLPDLPSNSTLKVDTFAGLAGYVTGYRDGWYRLLTEPGERSLNQAALLRGALLYTTYQPTMDPCVTLGDNYIYGLYYQTGTPWYKPIFGPLYVDINRNVIERLKRKGLPTPPSLNSRGDKAFVQTDRGVILEIDMPNTPLEDQKSSRVNWREITDE
ncbi:hypothetical protein G3N55_05835 [Dissulfurirhabdus thermomarina]|uniref:PilY1 beta-propeller domain-containing protein n=1 Tax=Dissulfurirhabdus thermomarina TaxID=1765737 RepID=A0A6N9TM59_DISTH|nr:PilC/PilY family type IV pilus protein [Dissulfurirhabdus thermomarina]NDY42362.1 hypothetical protein [Dissulfurirhabdus thermomarina]NMX23010.1 hypothetical protein [Dissulfurirhabdus thermomarina]